MSYKSHRLSNSGIFQLLWSCNDFWRMRRRRCAKVLLEASITHLNWRVFFWQQLQVKMASGYIRHIFVLIAATYKGRKSVIHLCSKMSLIICKMRGAALVNAFLRRDRNSADATFRQPVGKFEVPILTQISPISPILPPFLFSEVKGG